MGDNIAKLVLLGYLLVVLAPVIFVQSKSLREGRWNQLRIQAPLASADKGVPQEKPSERPGHMHQAQQRNLVEETRNSATFTDKKGGGQRVDAIYAFGDSTIDVGNNNYLDVNAFARANYYPYGRDFDTGYSTGRFSNGRLVVDFIAEKLNFSEYPSPFLANISHHILSPGINFASSDSGLVSTTGQEFGPVWALEDQVRIFRDNTMVAIQQAFQFKQRLVASHMDNSLFIISTGSNDLLTNDALSRILETNLGNITYEQITYDQMYMALWKQIKELYLLGARKFMIIEIGALGCTPNNMFTYNTTNGACLERLNDEVKNYNTNMTEFLGKQFLNVPNATYIIAPTFDAIRNIALSPTDFGFKYNAACCGGGLYGGMILCQFVPIPCSDSDEYVWFDAFHPSQRTYSFIADNIWVSLNTFLS